MGYIGDRTRFAKEMRAFSAMVQQLEDTWFEIAKMRLLAYAEGAQLDTLGELIGGGNSPREGLSDADYRTRLYAQCQINQSRGEPERLIAALNVYTGNVPNKYREIPNAIILIELEAATTPALLLAQMRRVKAAGVRLDIVRYDPAEAFMFASGDSPETDSDHGFSDDTGTTGGKLSELLT
jgi:hypothetical protein